MFNVAHFLNRRGHCAIISAFNTRTLLQYNLGEWPIDMVVQMVVVVVIIIIIWWRCCLGQTI